MPYRFRPTLSSHVPSRKRGLALIAFANQRLAPREDYSGEVDAELAALRMHISPGPRLPSQCEMCGDTCFSRTCDSCLRLLRREVALLHRKHSPPSDPIWAVCRHPSSRTLCLDHSHSDGLARGYVCFRCNAALALLDRNPGQFEDYVHSIN